jgi:membrane protease YdiL (CAAX protease family)
MDVMANETLTPGAADEPVRPSHWAVVRAFLLLGGFVGTHFGAWYLLSDMFRQVESLWRLTIMQTWGVPVILMTSSLLVLLLLWSQSRRSGAKPLWNAVELRDLRAWVLCAAVLAANYGAGLVQYLLLPQAQRPDLDARLASMITGPSGIEWPSFLPLAVFIILLAPVTEEWLFRGILQPALSRSLKRFFNARWSALIAIACTALLFGLIHWEPQFLLVYVVYGLTWGWLVHRRKSLTLSILVHMSLNASVIGGFFIL